MSSWVPLWNDETEDKIECYYLYPFYSIPAEFIREFMEVEGKDSIWKEYGNAPEYRKMDNRDLMIIQEYKGYLNYWEHHINFEEGV